MADVPAQGSLNEKDKKERTSLEGRVEEREKFLFQLGHINKMYLT